MSSEKEEKKKSPSLSRIIAAVVIIAALLLAGFFYTKYQQAQKLAQNPNIKAQEETKKLTEQVGKLIELPKDETPTVATVSDKSKLASQPFFQNAQNGDRVLIYTKAKKAILYRPSTNKIIEVAPVTIGSDQSAAPTNQPARVAILNGTSTAGLAGSAEKKLTDAVQNVSVVVKGNTANNYSSTIVVDLSGKLPDLARQIADLFGGKVGSLPSGETKPQADIVLILGK